ncbi:dTDP-4-dehydrorhamnose 3,5-epimerase [Corynebacterium mendelii]|uniref:dTDP-4-dehydrorhamnose 3,5-epimerase n=1 Tax=Corynebacterium mendelii TaxID=2765362 RepID=A0A939IWX6_9CORY|nr:dTDP-4-dehydrorhamnose 3,5-epimerase [Corynebacterium mendelii]MBN9643895.1 dTDP-4-dehydrorhamnose 3,5-epimerase [Corynebacterium mendelii]
MLKRDDTLPEILVNTPEIHPDNRGSFTEWFKASEFVDLAGHPFMLEQANVSTSKAGVIRGLHFAEVPPGQAKWVHCAAGRIIDVAVDIRTSSPTFGKHTSIELSADNRRCVYLPDGFAHGFVALTDATVVYLTSAEYNPTAEHAINPFDRDLAVDWPVTDPIVSDKDAAAASFADYRDKKLLPRYSDCMDYLDFLRGSWVDAEDEAD